MLSNPTIPVQLEPIVRIRKDILAASSFMSDEEARILVDTYYQVQDFRKASGNQIRSMVESGEPNLFLEWTADTMRYIENTIKSGLNRYTDEHVIGVWSKGIVGIGPVLSAGLMAHIDIERAPTVGHIWRFAGQDPTQVWGKGEKRPWNADLKVLCVHPDMRITTKRGHLPITEVRVGDKVLTHLGRWRRVTQVMVNEFDGELVGIRSANAGNQVAYLTPGHPVYAAPVETWPNGQVKDATQQGFGWHAVESVQLRWNLLRPRVQERRDDIPSLHVSQEQTVMVGGRVAATGRWPETAAPRAVSVQPSIPLTPDMMYLIGLYLGEGHVDRGRVTWSFHQQERALLTFVESMIGKLTSAQATVSYHPHMAVQVGVGCKPLAHMFRDQFGANGNDMHFPMEWLSLPDGLLQSLWRGIVDAEGDHVGKLAGRRISVKNALLARQIVDLGRRLGYSVSLHTEPNGANRIMVNERPDETPRSRSSLVMAYTGSVYNIEVEEDHSYIVEGYAVHNCWKIGQSFMKVQNNENDVYGKLYVERKAFEIDRNESGELADQAAQALERKRIGKETDAYKAYSTGMLPKAHIDARARRWTVKLFLSGWHEAAYVARYGQLPPKPYVIEHLGHVHYFEPPNMGLIPGWEDLRATVKR